MYATIRMLTVAIVFALIAGPAAWAACSCCGKDACGEEIADIHGCEYTPTEFASADTVHWNHRRVSFGNYLKFAKAEIPEPVMRIAPEFEPIYFDLDKAVLKPEGLATARKVAAYMKDHPQDKVRIEGNCCDLASNEYNQKLGMRRAEAVKSFLVSEGIDASRITTTSKGETEAVHSPQHRQMDRRADVIVWFLDAAK
jgi:outer membrane protein OmpA-like peptidoglycan-associated protein